MSKYEQSGRRSGQSTRLIDTERKLDSTVKKFDDYSSESVNSWQKKIDDTVSAFETRAGNSISLGEQRRDALIKELDLLESRIRDSIERATGYTLFYSFQKRQLDLQKSK